MVTVRKYNGTIPKSGKQTFPFGKEWFCHRSVKKDKSDYLVRISDGAILRAYPIGTDRGIVVEDLSSNLSKLSQEYELVEDEQVVKKKDIVASEQDTVGITMDYYSDRTPVTPRRNDIGKKSYNLLIREGQW